MPTRRVLKAAAHNLFNSLLSGRYGLQDGSLLDHLERAARGAGAEVVTIDLLSGQIEPPATATPALQRLGATAAKRMREIVAGMDLPMAAVQEAVLVYEVLCSKEGDAPVPRLTVRLSDDLGHQYTFDCPDPSSLIPAGGAPPPLPKRGERTETPLTRLFTWLEQFLPRLG